MKLLSFDLETTGLDLEKDRIMEIGWAIKPHQSSKHLAVRQFFAKTPGQVDFSVTKETEELTGITEAMWSSHAIDLERILKRFYLDVKEFEPSFIVAHNGTEFDRPFFERVLEDCGQAKPELEWIDTRTDIKYPKSFTGRSLLQLAAHHGFINPFPHSALFDCTSTLRILDSYKLKNVVERARSKTVTLKAHTNYDEREKAKSAKYGWDGAGKRWIKQVKELDLKEEEDLAAAIGFKFSIV